MNITESFDFSPVDEEEKLSFELVSKIMLDAALERASDIHLEPAKNESVIRYRIDGVMQEITRQKSEVHQAMIRIIKKMAKLNPDLEDLPQDGRVIAKTEQFGEKVKTLDYRISTIPTIYGEKVVFRILDPKNVEHTLSEGLPYIGFSGKNLEQLEKILSKAYGLVIFAGPPGSGKTTTVYASLAHLVRKCKGKCNLVSLENPVEYVLEGVIQTQLNFDKMFNYENGLKAVMRQDPDIIFVSDIPDLGTANMVMQSALTGHLVLTQMAASDAAHAIYNFIEMGVEPYLVSMILEGIIAQRLARRICPKCREKVSVNKALLSRIKDCIDDIDKVEHFYRGKGCEHCKGTGYRGRTALYQLIPRNQGFLDFLTAKPKLKEIQDKIIELGYPTLNKAAIKKALEGVITLEEAFRVLSWT